MLATEFFFSQTFSSRTLCKHTKSQQKSTYAKHDKHPSFVLPSFFPVEAMFLMQISCITCMLHFIMFHKNRIQHLKFKKCYQ